MVDTPEKQRDKLLAKMYARQEDVIKAENYYEGNHPLAFAARKYRQSFGNQLSAFSSNWCGLVIDVPTERLSVDGFRFGSQAANDKAWAVWKANNLHTESGIAHTEAAKHGCVYALVEPTDGTPIITIEHPLHMIVECSHENRRVQEAALKRWVDDDRYVYTTLYLPDEIYKWVSDKPVTDSTKVRWIEREPVATNPLGVVPVVELQNKPGLLKGGTSDLRDIIPLNDGLNKLMCDLLVASEFYAFPQKIALGLQEAEDENGNPIPMEKVLTDLAELWVLPAGADVKQLAASDLKAYSNAIQEFLQQLAALSRVPPNYLLGQMVNISGDALIAAEKGLTSKVKGKQKSFSTGWEDVMRLAFLAMGDKATADMSAEVMWADAESRTLAQIADPIIKLRQVLGVPLEACWAMLPNVTPQMIEEWKQLAGLPARAPQGGTFGAPPTTPAPPN
jgi:hypothetical protein